MSGFPYLEEDPTLTGLLVKSPLGPVAGKALSLTHRAGNEMGAGSSVVRVTARNVCLLNLRCMAPPSPGCVP